MTHAERCPICYGRGQVEERLYTGMSVSTGNSIVTCRSCGGRGIVEVADALPWNIESSKEKVEVGKE